MTLRCLIVEDQVMFLQLLCKMLQGLPGLEVVVPPLIAIPALKPVANSAQMP